MRKIRLHNDTGRPLRLNIEAWPDVYYIERESYVELSSPFIETGELLEFAVHEDRDEITLLFWDVESEQVDVFDAGGAKMEPLKKDPRL